MCSPRKSALLHGVGRPSLICVRLPVPARCSRLFAGTFKCCCLSHMPCIKPSPISRFDSNFLFREHQPNHAMQPLQVRRAPKALAALSGYAIQRSRALNFKLSVTKSEVICLSSETPSRHTAEPSAGPQRALHSRQCRSLESHTGSTAGGKELVLAARLPLVVACAA